MNPTPAAEPRSHRARLRDIAVEAVRARGLDPGLPPDAVAQVASR